ncbi:hypothetical protein C8F04DRAFT_979725 [Mycena alexandri]|uniref:Uncharacterized protein n=1 Tax=Mycena alexandri TaxID=1745969 RepID=A0AAD6RXT7_9AGAR|nr:hypothetical protein C8F04DRAFT_979725 [Mycena alexandri]
MKKRPRADGADSDEYSDEEGDGSGSEGEERAGTPPLRPAQSKRAEGGEGGRRGKKGGGGQTALGDDNVPAWASSAKVTLAAGGGGDSWAKIMSLWWDLEKKASFIGPGKGKGTSMRPKEVAGWISRARSGGPQPPIVDVFSFAARWWPWWVEINPQWRVRTGTTVKRLAKEGEGDWDSLASTGPNGMLNVLICLRWWYDALRGDEGGMEGWNKAVEDVKWALERIW